MKKLKRTLISVTLSFLMVVTLCLSPLASGTVKAKAVCYTYNPKKQVMTLHGTLFWEDTYNFADKDKVKHIVADPGTVFPPASILLFADYENCETIDLSNADTSQAVDMDCMFSNCTSLTDLDLSSFNTNKVTSMGDMFKNCQSLTKLDLSHFNTAKVTHMFGMFEGCTALTDLDLSGFDTRRVINISNMFKNCSALTNLKLGFFYCTNAEKTQDMFFNCSSLVKMNTKALGAPNAIHLDRMFYNCSSLKELDLSNFNSKKAFSLMDMFNGCSSLETIDLSGFYTDNAYQMQRFFKDCSSLKKLNLSTFKTPNLTETVEMFSGCSSLTSLDVSNLTVDKVRYAPGMFNGCSSLTDLKLGDFNTSNFITFKNFFSGCSSLTNLDLSNFDTSNLTIASEMFSGCSSLTSLDLSSFDTSKVTNMSDMFKDCSSLTELDLRPLETQSVNSISSMFEGCKNLQHIDLSNFSCPSVNSAYRLFKGCSNLKEIDLTVFAPAHLGSIDNMFDGCSSLESIDLSHIDLSHATWLWEMFSGCTSLKSLDLSNPTLTNIRQLRRTFYGCSNLTDLDLSGISGSNLESIDEMFTDCNNLDRLTLSATFPGIDESAQLSNGKNGWAAGSAGGKLISGTKEYAAFKNKTKTTYYKRVLLSGNLTVKDNSGNKVDTPICDMELNAFVENEECPDTNFSYQWKRDGVKIKGATSSTYTVGADDVDHKIACVVTDKTGTYHSELTYETANKTVKKPSPIAPLNLEITKPTTKGAADGKISGLTTDMEYALNADFTDAQKCTSSVIEGLTAGEYYVRIAETPTTYAGETIQLIIEDGPEPAEEPTDEHVHGGENAIFHEAKESTCTEVGNAAYYECNCGKFFSDKECTEEIEKDSWFRDKKGHDYGDATYTWSADNKTVTAKKVCQNDASHVETETVETTYEVIAPATDTAAELRRYTATFTKEGFETQTKDVEFTEESQIPSEEDVTTKFSDVKEGSWYVAAIQFVYDNKLMNGFSDNAFSPETTLTRAQFVTIIHNMEEKPNAEYKPIFTDVPEKQWFTTPVMWAYEHGITSGVSENEFGTDLEITREQLATLLYKYASQKDTYTLTIDDAVISTFPDAGQITDWAEMGMKWAVSNGIMNGKPDANGTNFLDPQGKATRAECAQMVKNYFDHMIQ